MSLYLSQKKDVNGKAVVLDDMILTTEFPTTAGSKMLEGYKSLFEAEVVSKLKNAGFDIAGKANVGELSLGLLGETSYFGSVTDEKGNLSLAASEILKTTDAFATIGLDASGAIRRSAALSGQVAVKPTYGTVSRFGTISVACSGEAVCVTARNASDAQSILSAIIGHDDKDGTSLSEEQCQKLNANAEFESIKKVAIAKSLAESADEATRAKIDAVVSAFKAKGIEVEAIDDSILLAAKTAWNVLMSAELCNNVSRYDGIKYGYRSQNYTTIGELYTNSRTEAFGELLKTAILYGSETLSDENYMKMYDKSMRVRRVLSEYFGELFGEYDALILPEGIRVTCCRCGASKLIPTDSLIHANEFLNADSLELE